MITFLFQADTSRIIWSYHSRDPTGLNNIPRHQKMGSTPLNLLGGLTAERVEENTDSFIIRNENVSCATKETNHYCV